MEDLKIDRNLKIPYYYQLYEKIAREIEANNIHEGEKLTGELDLCKSFGVSRITVRQALKELELNGYITRERGKGTFIRQRIETHSLQKVSSIIEELKKEGIKTKNRILENILINPDERIRKMLCLKEGEKILFIKRLVYAYNAPLYITRAFFPAELTGPIKNKILSEYSFTKIITEVFNLRLVHAKRILEAIVPDPEIASMLEINQDEKKAVNYLQTFWTVNHLNKQKTIYFCKGIF